MGDMRAGGIKAKSETIVKINGYKLCVAGYQKMRRIETVSSSDKKAPQKINKCFWGFCFDTNGKKTNTTTHNLSNNHMYGIPVDNRLLISQKNSYIAIGIILILPKEMPVLN